MTTTHEGLRQWAKGLYPLEAGVELLIRGCDGRFARSGYPWVLPTENGSWYLDPEAITEDTIGGVSGGERRLLVIAASLLGGEPVNLYEEIPGLDRDHLQLVLAAIAHANGSQEHSGLVTDDTGRTGFTRLDTAYAWPTT